MTGESAQASLGAALESPVPRAGDLNYASAEAKEFARRFRLEAILLRAIEIATRSFHVVAPIVISLDDPDADPASAHLVLEVAVSGDPVDVSRSHWNYALEAAPLLGPLGERMILVCDIR